MLNELVIILVLFLSGTPALAQDSIIYASSEISVGINLGNYPKMTRVPGHAVYYAPSLNANYFFFDGMYWVFRGDRWFASSWYNGPWSAISVENMPVDLLQVPVRYFRKPPADFSGWSKNAPPHWETRWGGGWTQQRPGWDEPHQRADGPPAPLPEYQRKFTGKAYPAVHEQPKIEAKHYRYQPQTIEVRDHYAQPRPADNKPGRADSPHGQPNAAPNAGQRHGNQDGKN